MTTTFNEQVDKMTEAEQLAVILEGSSDPFNAEVATELRRLHTENLEQRITIDNLKSKIDWLRDQRKILAKYGKQ